MVYTGDAMTSPSPEAPQVPSVCGPLSEGPSPRWQRSAQGLRWMRRATYASVAAYALMALAPAFGERAAPASFIAPSLFGALCVLAYGAGLWRFGSVPASTGAVRPARQAFACMTSGIGLLLLCHLPFVLPYSAVSSLGHWLVSFVLFLLLIVPVAMAAACWGLLVRALGSILRSLRETPPAWAPKALRVWGAWSILTLTLMLGLGLGLGLPLALPGVAIGWALGLVYAGGGAFALALASVMGRTARALARQESSETSLR